MSRLSSRNAPSSYLAYTASLSGLVFLALIIQQYLPVLAVFHDARILLLPAFFLCAAVTTNVPAMLLMAYLCGFFWDAQHYLAPSPSDPHFYPDPVPSMRFGYSIILYALMGFLMQGIRPLFREGKWYVSILLGGIALFLYLSAEYTLLTFIRGGLVFNGRVLIRILLSSLLSMPFFLPIFFLLFRLARACRYEIRYESLRRNRRLSLEHADY